MLNKFIKQHNFFAENTNKSLLFNLNPTEKFGDKCQSTNV